MSCHALLEAQEKAAQPRGVISKINFSLSLHRSRQRLTQAGVSPHKGLSSPHPALCSSLKCGSSHKVTARAKGAIPAHQGASSTVSKLKPSNEN